MSGYLDLFLTPKWMCFDEESLETYTGVVKPKYKLFIGKHSVLDEIYLFLKSTKSDQTVNMSCCIEIQQSEWEYLLDNKYLINTSRIDIRKNDFLNATEIEGKHRKSKFSLVAKLPEAKYYEMVQKTGNLRRLVPRMAPAEKMNIREVLAALIDDKDELKTKLSQIGL